MNLLIIVGICFAFVLLIFFMIYNGLIGKKNDVENSFAGIDVQLTKRYDLIPNLVETVKQYMQHEKDVLTQVTELRTKALSSGLSTDEKINIDNKISGAMGKIMVAVENYPDLKASQNFDQLQRSFNEVEEQLSAARRSFNAAVTEFNNGVEMFPSSIVAGMLNYKSKELFVAPEYKRADINVKNLFNS